MTIEFTPKTSEEYELEVRFLRVEVERNREALISVHVNVKAALAYLAETQASGEYPTHVALRALLSGDV